MKKRIKCLVSLLLGFVLGLVGCGPEDEDKGDKEEELPVRKPILE